MSEALTTYTNLIRREYATGQATEHSYRDSLKNLLLTIEPGLTVINEPKRQGPNAPDYIVERRGVKVGFVEAKDVDQNLHALDRRSQEQLKRYRPILSNLIVTNYLDFQWYVNGVLREEISIGSLRGGKMEIETAGFEAVADLLRRFTNTQTPTIKSPRELAEHMAKSAREIAALIEASLPDSESLKAQMQAFEQTLIPNLKADEFADMYAQTLAYGLFAARVQHGSKPPETFTLRDAFWELPPTNPFLRRLFQEIAPQLDERVRWLVETLTQVLAHADTDAILTDFGKSTRQEDAVVHFYETFLREYDPKTREQRGVYYTPEPVVSYIVRSVDHLLRERFDRDLGLADPNTLILDPATGTGTFLYFVVQHIHETLSRMGQTGSWNTYVRDHLLPRLFGFELLMAPYAVAHMKLGIQLRDLGYDLSGDTRLGVYLTNTLEEVIHEGQAPLGFANFITTEANEAVAIKRAKPIMVVLGNPPYSNFGQLNQGEWIDNLLDDYKKGLKERKLNLKDDFIKFIRFGQWRIEKSGEGILAFVTNNTFIDGLTHRRMRQSLMETFTDIYILNLHGNILKQEKAPNGSSDENVFDIQQGVAITLFIKEREKKTPGNVYYMDLWGERDYKYKWLAEHDITTTQWQALKPTETHYFFVPRNVSEEDSYTSFWSVNLIFPLSVSGIQTGRDEFVSRTTQAEFDLWINQLTDKMVIDKEIGGDFLPKWSGFDLAKLRGKLQHPEMLSSMVTTWFYRPFDVRPIIFDEASIKRSRGQIMAQLQKPNYALITVRQQATTGFRHVFVADRIGDGNSISLKTREYNCYYPLYLYPDPDDKKLLSTEGDYPPGKDGRVPNLNPAFVRELSAKIGLAFVSDGRGDLAATFGPEDVFHYAYAVFHSPIYRARYAEFLKIDFPRLPLTSDQDGFRTLCGLGARLVDLHLLKNVGALTTGFRGEGANLVEKGYPKYVEPKESVPGRVYINKTQYVEGVPPDVWEFQVGGYQVLEKWLKDRRGRALSFEDTIHYQKIAAALGQTIALMETIDETIPDFPLS